MRGLQPKAPIYGALCGLLAANPQGEPDGVVAADIVAQLGRELQEALDVHATFSIRAFCRFAIELANARVASVDSALALLETLLAVTAEPGVLPARAEWFACVVLDSLALGGEVFTRDAPERSAALLGAGAAPLGAGDALLGAGAALFGANAACSYKSSMNSFEMGAAPLGAGASAENVPYFSMSSTARSSSPVRCAFINRPPNFFATRFGAGGSAATGSLIDSAT